MFESILCTKKWSQRNVWHCLCLDLCVLDGKCGKEGEEVYPSLLWRNKKKEDSLWIVCSFNSLYNIHMKIEEEDIDKIKV